MTRHFATSTSRTSPAELSKSNYWPIAVRPGKRATASCVSHAGSWSRSIQPTCARSDIQRKELKLYVAYKRLKNFATLVAQKSRLLLYLHLDPSQLGTLPGNARDMGQQGHWGTGDLEMSLASEADLELAKPLLQRAYEGRLPPH